MTELATLIAAPPRITWWVYAGGERIRRQASMRSTWAYDATCSCGWDSKTGGAVERHVIDKVNDHKRYDHAPVVRKAAPSLCELPTARLTWERDVRLPEELATTTHARRRVSLRAQLAEVTAELARRAALPLQVECDHCSALHDATYHHEGAHGEGAVYEVTCTVDGLADYYLTERLIAR